MKGKILFWTGAVLQIINILSITVLAIIVYAPWTGIIDKIDSVQISISSVEVAIGLYILFNIITIILMCVGVRSNRKEKPIENKGVDPNTYY